MNGVATRPPSFCPESFCHPFLVPAELAALGGLVER